MLNIVIYGASRQRAFRPVKRRGAVRRKSNLYQQPGNGFGDDQEGSPNAGGRRENAAILRERRTPGGNHRRGGYDQGGQSQGGEGAAEHGDPRGHADGRQRADGEGRRGSGRR